MPTSPMTQKYSTNFASVSLGLCFFCLFFRLDQVPNGLVHWTAESIEPQVRRAIEGTNISSMVRWKWNSGELSHGGYSPVMHALVFSGIRIFGLNLFGLRIFPCLLGFVTLCLAYWYLSRHYQPAFLFVFFSLLVSSPWYLMYTRSALSAGVTLSLSIVAFCCLGFFAERYGGYVAPLVAGVATALIPYTYAIGRHIPIAILLTSLVIKPRSLAHYLLFLLPIGAELAYHFPNFSDAAMTYFSSRGENLLTANVVEGSYDWPKICHQLVDNIHTLGRHFSGLNWMKTTIIAYNTWTDEVPLYPIYLVPFFTLGVSLSLINFCNKPCWKSGIPLGGLIIGIIPGLGVGIGQVCSVRLFLTVIPLYYFCAQGLMWLLEKLIHSGLWKSSPALKEMAIGIPLSVFLSFVIWFQALNFFDFDRDHPSFETEKHLGMYLDGYYHRFPNGKAALCLSNVTEFPYVPMMVFASDELRHIVRKKRLQFYRLQDLPSLSELRAQGIQLLLMSSECLVRNFRFPKELALMEVVDGIVALNISLENIVAGGTQASHIWMTAFAEH